MEARTTHALHVGMGSFHTSHKHHVCVCLCSQGLTVGVGLLVLAGVYLLADDKKEQTK